MGKRKTTYYIDDEILMAAKLTAVATHRSESALVENALRLYLIDEGRAQAAQDDLRSLLEGLRRRPGLNDLDDPASMALAVREVRAARNERGPSRSAG